MGKLAYFFTTLIGAVPAGFGLYVFIQNFLERGDNLGTLLLSISIVVAVCLTLVALTPFMVLIWYKDSRPALAVAGTPAGVAEAPSKKKKKKGEDEDFGDAIPEDFDENELKDEAEVEDADYEAVDSDYGAYDESELDDFDLNEEEEEEPAPKKKSKKK